MPRKWTEAKVSAIDKMSPTVMRVLLSLSGNGRLEFKPGQFITFDLDIGEKRLERWRSYSIAGMTQEDQDIELTISYVPGGRATEYFFNTLKAGDTLRFKGPEGAFVLPTELNKPLVMICTGTGVAPFKAMIDHIYDKDIAHKGIHLIFGTRTKEGILYHDHFKNLAQNHANFRYSVALSREPYEGYQGYVHDIYESAYQNDAQDKLFLLCGWQNMIDEAVERLKAMGCPPSQVKYELYG